MQNGQLKPAYNWQISTANQYVTHYSIHQTTTDTTLLKEHLSGFQEQYQQMPESITADAGYGSEENYAFLQENSIEAFVKFNLFHHEQTDKFKAQINKIDNLFYNQQQNCFSTCQDTRLFFLLFHTNLAPTTDLNLCNPL